MTYTKPRYQTLDDWASNEALSFSPDSPDSFRAAIDTLMAALGSNVELLGLGEALHGGEEILLVRNRLFQYLVEHHGYSAIALETSFPKAQAINDYIAGHSATNYEAIQDSGWSHNLGRLHANRELVEWMRLYNAQPAHTPKLCFYGADSPTEMTGTDSPRQVLYAALDFLASIERGSELERRQRIDALLGSDAAWENPAAMMDPSQAIGLFDAATALRIETENLISQLQIRRPELIAKGGADPYWHALHHAIIARQLLNYHAVLATPSERRVMELLGIRDAMMADNLAYAVSRERGRGRVLVYAHNRHVQHGKVVWQLGPHLNIWWPAGSHLKEMLGQRYVAIGTGVGVSTGNGIGQPEPGTLEALLATGPQPGILIPTHGGQHLPAEAIAALPTRSGSSKNSTYMPLSAESFAEVDWLLVLASSEYSRGGPQLNRRE